MKIGIVCGDCETIKESEAKRKIAYTWEEIEEYKKQGLDSCDRQTFIMVKILEENKDFENLIYESRKARNIGKNGISIEEYLTAKMDNNPPTPTSKATKVLILNNRIPELDEKFRSHLNVHRWINTIMCCGVIFPYQAVAAKAITFNAELLIHSEEQYEETFPLKINIGKKIKKKELIKFINSNWEHIKEKMDNMSELEITEDDYNLYKKKKDKTHREIADELSPIDDIDARINEDSIRQKYHRATQKINAFLSSKA